MRNIWILTRTLLKNTYRSGGQKKKIWFWLALVLLAVCCLPLIYFIYYQLFYLYFSQGMTGLGLQLGFLIGTVFVIFTALFSFPTMLYFSQDTMVLLPLPVKPRAIVMAKLIIIYLSCLSSVLFTEVPMAAAYAAASGNIAGTVMIVLQMLLTSLSAVLILGILTVIVMRFLPLFANKDRFNLIIGLLAIVFSLAVSISASRLGESMGSSDMEVAMIMIANLQKGGLLPMAMNAFFWLQPAIESIVSINIWQTVLSILLPVILMAVFFWLSDLLYLPSVTRSMETGSSRKGGRLHFTAASYTKAAVKNDFRILFRTPAYLTNCVLSSFMMPVVMAALLLLDPAVAGMELYVPDSMAIPLGFIIGTALTFLAGSLNAVSGTAISREGTSGVQFMKTIPVPMKKQLHVKLYTSVLFTFIGCLCFLVLFHIFFQYTVWADLTYVLSCALTAFVVNWTALFCDGMRPKLVWENETVAVKNNYNLVFSMLISWGMLAILVLPGWLIMEQIYDFSIALTVYAVVLAGLLIVLFFLLEYFAPRLIARKLSSLS